MYFEDVYNKYVSVSSYVYDLSFSTSAVVTPSNVIQDVPEMEKWDELMKAGHSVSWVFCNNMQSHDFSCLLDNHLINAVQVLKDVPVIDADASLLDLAHVQRGTFTLPDVFRIHDCLHGDADYLMVPELHGSRCHVLVPFTTDEDKRALHRGAPVLVS